MMKTILFYKLIVILQIWMMPLISSIHCPSCEKVHCPVERGSRLRCKGGVTRGICGCCPTCAKVEGERCGGDFEYLGKCDKGLFCQMRKPKYIGRQPDGHCRKGTNNCFLHTLKRVFICNQTNSDYSCIFFWQEIVEIKWAASTTTIR